MGKRKQKLAEFEDQLAEVARLMALDLEEGTAAPSPESNEGESVAPVAPSPSEAESMSGPQEPESA